MSGATVRIIKAGKGTLHVDAESGDATLVLPLEFDLEPNESPTLYGASLHYVSLGRERVGEGEEVGLVPVRPNDPDTFPIRLRGDDDVPDKVQFVVKFEAPDLPEVSGKRPGELVLDLSVRGKHVLPVRVRFQWSPARALSQRGSDVVVVEVGRGRQPRELRTNFGALLLLFAAVFAWNATYNDGVRGGWTSPVLVASAASFALGFFGLQIVALAGWFRTLSGIIAVWRYPELYLEPATVTILGAKATAPILATLGLALAAVGWSGRAVVLPDPGDGYAWVYDDDRNHEVRPGDKIPLREAKRVVLTWEDSSRVARRIQLARARTAVDWSEWFGSLAPRLAVDYDTFSVVYSEGVSLSRTGDCDPERDEEGSYRGEFTVEDDLASPCVNWIRPQVVAVLKGARRAPGDDLTVEGTGRTLADLTEVSVRRTRDLDSGAIADRFGSEWDAELTRHTAYDLLRSLDLDALIAPAAREMVDRRERILRRDFMESYGRRAEVVETGGIEERIQSLVFLRALARLSARTGSSALRDDDLRRVRDDFEAYYAVPRGTTDVVGSRDVFRAYVQFLMELERRHLASPYVDSLGMAVEGVARGLGDIYELYLEEALAFDLLYGESGGQDRCARRREFLLRSFQAQVDRNPAGVRAYVDSLMRHERRLRGDGPVREFVGRLA
ncbi:hypothetical protein [Rubrivirga marina]|uniref:Uncharacterized protein n=1 Tax=Rubrivirga marina TaxID=1196024 RepID=A0A271IWI8_9BACT|nr:hypothetical protein [Rubrivirga marina]PAP75298.1 hypothetical protein BSZ37_01990 [Rubrivirga marina]